MSNYYPNQDSAMNEARNILSSKNYEELNKLMHNEEELTKFIANLNEV